MIINHGLTKREGITRPDSRSIFEIGSITKVFTALALQDMKARGELDLRDSVGKYLPHDAKVPDSIGRKVTLLDLATHASGLPRMPYRQYIRPDDGQHPFSRLAVEDAYRFLREVKLEFSPGSKYSYSNVGYALLGHVLELVSGLTYQTLIRTRICGPIGLRDTSIDLTVEQRRRFCLGYSHGGAPKSRRKLEFMAPAGGLRSTVDDLSRFIQTVGDSKSALAKRLRACMTIKRRWSMNSASRLRSDSDMNGLREAGVGLGWHVYSFNDKRLVWHSGGTRGFSAFIGVDTISGAGVVLLTNTNGDITDCGIKAALAAVS